MAKLMDRHPLTRRFVPGRPVGTELKLPSVRPLRNPLPVRNPMIPAMSPPAMPPVDDLRSALLRKKG